MVYVRDKEKNAQYMREYRAKKAADVEYVEKTRTYMKKYAEQRKASPDDYIRWKLTNLKCRAKQEGFGFDITADDLPIPEFCPVLGVKLDMTGEDHNARISVDRVDNCLGYVKGNVRVISNKANTCKRDLSVEQVRNLLDYMEGNR